jgi:hypothetical protein
LGLFGAPERIKIMTKIRIEFYLPEDIIIEVPDDATEEQIGILVLDAKYKEAENLLDIMDWYEVDDNDEKVEDED